jgi:hypothetical protein
MSTVPLSRSTIRTGPKAGPSWTRRESSTVASRSRHIGGSSRSRGTRSTTNT